MGNSIKAEVRGMARQWKVNTDEEMERFLQYFSAESASYESHIGMSSFTVKFTKFDGSIQTVYIGSTTWEIEGGGGGPMAENWRSYFYDLSNHDPSIRKAELDAAEHDRIEQLEELEVKLSSFVIDEVKFNNAQVSEILGTLTFASRDLDPEGIGVNIIFMDSENHTQTKDNSGPRITINLRNVSIWDALIKVSALSNRPVRYRHNMVIVGYPRLINRVYAVNPEQIDLETQSPEKDLKERFQNQGIHFPIETSITYDSNFAIMVITHNEDTFPDIESVWEEINSTSSLK
jgi:hypothetical protein